MLDCFVDGSVHEEGFIDDSDPIVNKFGSGPDSYPTEIDPVLYDVTTFAFSPRACLAACRL